MGVGSGDGDGWGSGKGGGGGEWERTFCSGTRESESPLPDPALFSWPSPGERRSTLPLQLLTPDGQSILHQVYRLPGQAACACSQMSRSVPCPLFSCRSKVAQQAMCPRRPSRPYRRLPDANLPGLRAFSRKSWLRSSPLGKVRKAVCVRLPHCARVSQADYNTSCLTVEA